MDNKITLTGAVLVYDESLGLQNATETPSPTTDSDDNDMDVSLLPAIFSDRLEILGAVSPKGAALSGYAGNNTGEEIFTVSIASNGTFAGISLTGSTGAALNGEDSMVQTLAGNHIFLYTDSENDNIVLGREGNGASSDPNGSIVFAIFVEETVSVGGNTTGGKLWTAHYEEIKHSNSVNTVDEVIDLSGVIYVGVAQDLEFSLSGAPSGQNLFLMYTTANPNKEVVDGIIRITDPAIIATGLAPANESTGVSIVSGDTINSSQAGGPTTFGSNNQMLAEGEGIRFSFVTGAREDVTIPNLDQNEADIEENIDFTGLFNARAGSFEVVQLQSGKSAVIKISAFNTDLEPGVEFIDGYDDDTLTAIAHVIVKDTVTGEVIESSDGTYDDANITIAFDNAGFVTISGIQAGHKIEYATDIDHNRVLVENAGNGSGNDSAAFDIGEFKLIQVATETIDIGTQIFFEDDRPGITVETTGVPDTLQVDESDLATDASADFSDNFSSTPAYGADGAGTVSSSYALSVSGAGAASGLVDTASGESVLLRETNGVVEGYTATGNALVFSVRVDADGIVTLDQQRAVVHPDGGDPNDTVMLSAAELIALTRSDTITDADGDSGTDSAVIAIGQALRFGDDGPTTVNVIAATDTLQVDESDLATDASADFSDNFSSTPAYGADGAGEVSSSYALSVSGAGAASGLTDTASGESVLLRETNGVVEGYTATGNALVFSVRVDADGIVTLDQQRAVVHPDGGDPNDTVTLSAAELIALTRSDTIIDADGDTGTGSAVITIGQALRFSDDGPGIDFANLIGTGTLNSQYGIWNYFAGADQQSSLDLSLTQFQLIKPDNTVIAGTGFTFTELLGSPDSSGDYFFEGSLTADFDNNASTPDTTNHFTLTAFADGRYKFDLENGFGSITTLSSTDGSLDAGGPDSVRTLTIADEGILFFGVRADTPVVDIFSAIELGESDLTEAEIETGGFAFLGSADMNVSTSGIGIGNNNLNGNSIAGVQADDESFLINPQSLLTHMKVFVDGTVGGYDTANEELYYSIFYSDGTTEGPMLVGAGDLSPEDGGRVSFGIERTGSKLIDAVQLTMSKGTIKVPLIEFTQENISLVSDVNIDFSAVLTDADGDSRGVDFSVDLFADVPGIDNFDYELNGALNDLDIFNVDLSVGESLYQILNFDIVTDRLVLLEDPGASFSIDNNGPDSIVSITESGGGEMTVVTVVGVDLDASHIILAG